ncbi:hypothetical protein [Paractinoplanes abujensis]|uniref:Uncharacterized protein n=1 Tax=Paractinoplanes abujensis TaxID=882441 RepID=A0A7W7CLL9_9ACTN|nr:hypothetical protein [Actinoplanes abujensis]MBB4690544.1 hypothetical protein [Actinoplanes abujensis]
MPAVMEATRSLARRAARPETPARLRLLVTVTLLAAAALLVSSCLVMARVQQQVRVIGDEAAPQAATAADLYFALSDMDAQVARLVLTSGRAELAGSRIDALGAYQQRGRQIDTDLQLSLTTATVEAERAIVLDLMHGLGVYRERVWQALTAGPSAAGYYTQATNVLHLDLLPAATRLREAGEARLDEAYGQKSATQTAGVVLIGLLGGALFVLLVVLQIWLARRFRRILSPALITTTVLTVLLLVPLTFVLVVQGQTLGRARDRSLVPFLDLSQARAVSYDAAADTSRYLISDGLDYYRQDFDRKAGALEEGDSGLPAVAGGSDVAPFATEQVVERWRAYRAGHRRIVQLADAGRDAEAIGALTGIRRGDAAFDFSYYDAAVAGITATRKDRFDRDLRDVEILLTGWPYIPAGVLGLVLLLVPLAVRKRFAEYR